jgi:alkylhydroperoxidase family enzyme
MYLPGCITKRRLGCVDKVPRIPFDDLPRGLQARLRPRVERLGYLGEFFQVAAHQPEALSHFIDFTEALKHGIEWRLVEVIALTVATETGNGYERVQHERLALQLGMTTPEIRALTDGLAAKDRHLFTPAELAAVRLARQVVQARGQACTAAYEALGELVGVATAIGCLMTATRYLAHATMANTWGVRAPVASPIPNEGASV